jgi:hypothetical protein
MSVGTRCEGRVTNLIDDAMELGAFVGQNLATAVGEALSKRAEVLGSFWDDTCCRSCDR